MRRSFTPSVIEPSFGVGRILYCLFEHAFYARDGKKPFTTVKPPVGCSAAPLASDISDAEHAPEWRQDGTQARVILSVSSDGQASLSPIAQAMPRGQCSASAQSSRQSR